MQVMGVTLIAAAIVIPPIVARLLTDSFSKVMVLSVVVGAACGLVGMYLSYFVDVSSGANVVLVAAAAFVLAMAYSGLRNRLATARGALAMREQTVLE
jgi:manganese/iron transport system permease protein/iron/zinc/copper transport system permease protein